MGLVCEHFHCDPQRALQLIDDDIDGLLFRIIDLRVYARAKEIFDTTPVEKRKNTPLMDMVGSVTVELAKERIQRKLDDQRR